MCKGFQVKKKKRPSRRFCSNVEEGLYVEPDEVCQTLFEAQAFTAAMLTTLKDKREGKTKQNLLVKDDQRMEKRKI